jgi:CubicO group peptidase (beta-lactamase class C family)
MMIISFVPSVFAQRSNKLEFEMKKFLILVLALLIVISVAGCPAAPVTTPPLTSPIATISSTPPVSSVTPPVSSPAPAASATASPSPSSAAAVTVTPTAQTVTLEQRLALLVDQMEQQRKTLHIPGMALAVVKDDKIILARGFGVANLEKNTPVSAETVFPIGSCTKAFTSALVGMMVDEGKMNWNDPLTRFLPYYQLKIQTADPSAHLTMVDVLSHRSGFPRMGILTASSKVPIEEVLKDAAAAEPYAPFRQRFYYSNEVYMSAGVAAAKASGTDWASLVQQKIITHLGMTSTTTSIAAVQKDPRLSLGYLWDGDISQYKLQPMRNVDNIAPAGAINSNVLDMAQWLRLQLGKGVYQGKRLISEASISEIRKGYIQIAPEIDYGLGWMIRSWKDQVVIEHGGNVDGFSAEVAMLPDANLGFVLLTNSSVNVLQQQSINLVWEALLGEWQGTDISSKAAQFAPYLGPYIANFAEFKDTEFTVLIQNNRLAVDIPGQMVFELKEADAAGKWYFAMTDQVAVSFVKDEKGNIIGMKLYQAGLEFEIPRKGIEIKPDIPLADLQKYLGSYRSADLNMTVIMEIQNNRLAIGIPGQMVYELFPPDKDGKWVFRVTSALSLSFNQAADGKIDRLTMYQGSQKFVMPRVEGVSLPSVEDLLKLRQVDKREAALKAAETLRMDGVIYIEQSGVKGKFSLYVAAGGKYRVDEDYGKYGSASTAIDGQHARLDSSFGPFEELDGKLLEQAKLGHPASIWGDWRDYYDSIKVVRSEALNGKTVYVVDLKQGELPVATLYLDTATGDILKSETISLHEGDIGIRITTLYEDYRDVQGLRLAFKEISSNEQSGRVITTYEKIEPKVTIAENFFILTPAVR